MDTASHDTNLLAAHLDGRLGDQESADLIAHLAECAECRATLAGFAQASTRGADRRVGGSLVSPRFSRPAVWLPIAAMVAIGTLAGVVTLRLNRSDRAIPAVVSAPAQAPPIAADPRPSAAPVISTPAPPTRAGRGTSGDGTLLPKRGGERTVGAKVFRFEAGEWIDTSDDRLALLPVVDARTPEEQAALLGRIPDLRPYAALGIKVLVVHDGTVYRIGPFNAARP